MGGKNSKTGNTIDTSLDADTVDSLKSVFTKIDTDGNQQVSFDELLSFYTSHKDADGKIVHETPTPQAVAAYQTLFDAMDKDHDGKVTIQEYITHAEEEVKRNETRLALAARPGIYVINGFYASMRQVYTAASAKIHWYDVEWESKDNSWEDFRGKVLGATDPTTAAAGSLRRLIFEQYEALGLTEEPNVGLNGVHASASPFEAYAERLNWLKAAADADSFGVAALAAGVNAEVLAAWTKDPQVDLKAGGKGSLFDQLEDQSVEECLATMQELAQAEGKAPEGLKNRAFVFVKPHAVTDATLKLVADTFAAANITILADGELTGPEIEQNLFIDNHYLSIATKASLNKPAALNPPAAGLAKFYETFGLHWSDVQDQGRMFNAVDACSLTGVDGNQLDTLWANAKKTGNLVKLSGGFYCGRIPALNFSSVNVASNPTTEQKDVIALRHYQKIVDITDAEAKALFAEATSRAEGKDVVAFPALSSKFVLNGFYAGMRSKFTDPAAQIHWYVVEFPTSALTWANFRGQILGATDPVTAESGSLRRTIFDEWKALGLASEPNVGDNGVHASASPFEALAEQLNWLDTPVADQPFGAAALGNIPAATIEAWTKDPQVDLKEGGKGSLFDQVEDQSVEDCLATLQGLAGVDVKAVEGLVNRAFVFIKPHATNDAVQKLVADKFAAANITILSQGDLTGPVIDEKKYIDNHYYSIASKASLCKPADLNPPATGLAKFAADFGVSWGIANELGVLFNAVDGQAALGMTGDELDAQWAVCKKNKHLVKLSGGFYAGRIHRVTW
jgi:nucleoside diphosphate kinase